METITTYTTETVTTTVSKPHTVYRSFDGIDFDNQRDCWNHEDEIIGKLEIPRLNGYVPMGIDSLDRDDAVNWYLVSSQNEFKNILEAHGMDEDEFFPMDEPHVLCVVSGDYNRDVYRLDGTLRQIRDFLNAADKIAEENPAFAAIYNEAKAKYNL